MVLRDAGGARDAFERLAPGSQPTLDYLPEADDDEWKRLIDYWRIVRKRLWLVIGICLITTALTTIYMARQPDIYQASARVQVNSENDLGYEIGNTKYLFGPISDPTYFNTQLQNLTSQALLRRVVKTLDLEHNVAFLQPQGVRSHSTWRTIKRMSGFADKQEESKRPNELPLVSSVAPAVSRDDLAEASRLSPYVGMIQAQLRVDPVKETRAYNKETRLIDLTYSHNDPQVAARVVNGIAETFVRSNLEKKNETNVSTGEFLQERVAELQSQIRADEERLLSYAKSHEILSLDARQDTVVERLSGLNKQLLEAENDRKLAEAAYNVAKTPAAASAMVETVTGNSRLSELRQKRVQLLQDATEQAPEVKEIDAQIAELEKQQQEAKSNATTTLLTNLESRYRQTLAREEALRKAFEQQRSETLTQNEAAINYHIIEQEITTNKGLLDNLLQRLKANDVVLASKPNNITIVDYAVVPDSPVGPTRLRAVFLALMLSLGAAVGLAVLLEYMDDNIYTADDVGKYLRLPALAVIPSIIARARPRFLPPSMALRKRNGNDSSGPELLVNADGSSGLAEAYRQLRTSVLLSTAGRAPKTLLVTSALPGEGKTTTAVNTAIALAQTGARIVLVDGDMRKPRLHSIFNLEDREGLSSILSSDPSDAEMLNLIMQDEGTGLHLLASGPIPPNPAELLCSEQMRRLMKLLGATFTHIVIDSPPVNSFTDGVLMSSMVDGVLLVVEGGKSSWHVVRRSKQMMQDVGAKIVGVVLNNVSLRPGDYYYYQPYYYRYYKGESKGESTNGRDGDTA